MNKINEQLAAVSENQQKKAIAKRQILSPIQNKQ